jgi:hypothetical protein
MEKEFIPYEQALELKELGFDEPCFKVYDTLGYIQDDKEMDNLFLEKCLAPLYQQCFKWFRDKRNIHGIVSYYGKGQWNIEILDYKGNELIQIEDNTFWSYEEAELECLKKLMEIVKLK